MARVHVTRKGFLADLQGSKFADVVHDEDLSFDRILAFFNNADRQRRMEESELHHDRAPLAGVVRELESLPEVDDFLGNFHDHRSTRLRQAIGVLVRIIMEQRGWCKTGKKGSLGVRAAAQRRVPAHNSGGLAFWFIRAERYERAEGMPFLSVRERGRAFAERKSSKPNRRRPKTQRKRAVQ